MIDILRSLRLGAVNLIGITMPGLLLILFISAGFILPILNFLIQISLLGNNNHSIFTWETIYKIFYDNKFFTGVLLFLLAYLLGYVIRLWTVDELDKRSADEVLISMAIEENKFSSKKSKTLIFFKRKTRQLTIMKGIEIAKEDCWPYQRDKYEKFPYFYTKKYLERRGLDAIAKYVIWGPKPDNEEEIKFWCQRSKAIINIIKIAIEKESSQLSAIVESNEAHIRLLFGTWEVSRISFPFLITGIIFSFFFCLNQSFNWIHINYTYIPYGVLLFICGILLIFALWLEQRIRKLFHYQRVRELTQILGCAYFVDKKKNTISQALNTL